MSNMKIVVKPDYSKIPNKMHLDAQIRFPHRVQRDRTKYTRKTKHKNSWAY